MLYKNTLLLNCSLDRIEETVKRFAPFDPLAAYAPQGKFKMHKAISRRDRRMFCLFTIKGNYELVENRIKLSYTIFPVWWEWIVSIVLAIIWLSSIFMSFTNKIAIYAVIGFSALNILHSINIIWQMHVCKNKFERFLIGSTEGSSC